jgi:hypothetical protein
VVKNDQNRTLFLLDNYVHEQLGISLYDDTFVKVAKGRHISVTHNAGFTYRLDRLKPRGSTYRGSPAKVYNSLNTVIGLSHLCCHNVLYFLNNPSETFLTQLHAISEYCRILNTPHYLRLYWNWTHFYLPPFVKVEELRGA